LIDRCLVVELKAAEAKPEKFRRQVVSYLKALDLPRGLVINFNSELLKDGIARVSNRKV
jgi:GxxExxY protein